MPPTIPLIPAIRPASTAKRTVATPIMAPPASALQGVKAVQSIVMVYSNPQ
jgi:hypothetical protein